MGKVNYYRSSAEPEPHATTEVRHLLPGNSQRAAYVYIALHTGEDEGGTKTNSLQVNDELTYLAGTHAMHAVEDEGETETNTNSLKVNPTLPIIKVL